MSSTWGRQLRLSIWGESHSQSIGAVLDGLPAGEQIDMEELLFFMSRRSSQGGSLDTPRVEKDYPEIQSGIVNNITCGTPVCAVIHNGNTRSKDYSQLACKARPGHADYTGFVRYGGHNDIRGGGHFSGRLTAPLVFAGGLCRQLLARRGIAITAHITSIHHIQDTPFPLLGPDKETASRLNRSFFPVLDEAAGQQMRDCIEAARREQNSVGGVVECALLGLPAGLGDPIFDNMESALSSLLFAIPGVKGVEFGAGFAISQMMGSQSNDPFYMKNGSVYTKTNNNGGILGGITSGMPVIFRVAFKPTPSIGLPQETVDFVRGENTELTVQGRHDPCIVRRAVPCVEAAAALSITDLLLCSQGGWK